MRVFQHFVVVAAFLSAMHFGNAMAQDGAIGIEFDPAWGPKVMCQGSSKPSPRITLTRVPDKAVEIAIRMIDLSGRYLLHGAGSVNVSDITDNVIPEGAFYVKRPCPRGSNTHRYEFSFDATDADGNTVWQEKAVLPLSR